MVGARRLLDAGSQTKLKRWLWFLAAYLLMIVTLAWLAGYVDAPASPHLGWPSSAAVYLLLKALLSGAIIAAASELARRSSLLAAAVLSLPLTSILAIVWLSPATQQK